MFNGNFYGKKFILTSDASGAAMAGAIGLVVVVVDVIDFSTSMEAALDAGAAMVYGAAPDAANPPVRTDPRAVGRLAGADALRLGTGVLVLAEPRVGGDKARREGIQRALEGITSSGAKLLAVIPNLGAETCKLSEMGGKVVLGVTGSGGVAFDAALHAGAPSVITGTVARTLKKNGFASAREGAARAIAEAARLDTGIAVAAASGNAPEDLLAAEFIYKKIMEMVRLNLL